MKPDQVAVRVNERAGSAGAWIRAGLASEPLSRLLSAMNSSKEPIKAQPLLRTLSMRGNRAAAWRTLMPSGAALLRYSSSCMHSSKWKAGMRACLQLTKHALSSAASRCTVCVEVSCHAFMNSP